MSATVIGVRHTPECNCGCQRVVGVTGRIVEARPDLDLLIAMFPCPECRSGHETGVAYSYADVSVRAAA